MIGATRVQVWADVKKKHSAHAITADVSLEATAHTVEFMGADLCDCHGQRHWRATEHRQRQRGPVSLLLIPKSAIRNSRRGSVISAYNITEFYGEADGFIVGSAFKVEDTGPTRSIRRELRAS